MPVYSVMVMQSPKMLYDNDYIIVYPSLYASGLISCCGLAAHARYCFLEHI
jgi:hypothetical protein